MRANNSPTWNSINSEKNVNQTQLQNQNNTKGNNEDSEEYFRATLIYFVFCMILILFFSLGFPRKIRRIIRQKCPGLTCLTQDMPNDEE